MYRRKKVSFIGNLRKSKESVELTVPKRIVDMLGLLKFIEDQRAKNNKAYVNIDLEVLE